MARGERTSDSEFSDQLRGLDPAADDLPPAPGSSRYESIMETAMTHTELDTQQEAVDRAAPQQPASGPRRSRWLLVGAAAVLAIVLAGVLTLQLATAPSATAAIASAAANLNEIHSMKAELTATGGGNRGTSHLRTADGDFVITGETRYADGHTESSTFTVVDGMSYETIAGRTTKSSVPPQQLPAPFASSSAAVISAALDGSQVIERGEERIGGVTTTRYDIDLSDQGVEALSDLTPNQLGWFELEYPEQTRRLTLWIADDLIRQVEVDNAGETNRARYYDFNGQISIEAPPGPYAEPDG